MNNDDLRNRWKSVKRTSAKEDDSFSFWDDQKKMKAEDERLEREMREAKRRAKELKKTLYKNKYGDVKNSTNNTISKIKNKAKPFISKGAVYVKRYKKALAVVLVIAGGFTAYQLLFTNTETNSGLLGESTPSDLVITEELPREKPEFSLLYPSGKDSSNYDVVRISPPEASASYTYLDRFTEDGQIFRVTQQEIPSNFDLEEAATNFQATSIIQVNENKIFHGFSEQGGVQSLLFIKNDKLILIRSPQKFNDDLWANYYLSLN